MQKSLLRLEISDLRSALRQTILDEDTMASMVWRWDQRQDQGNRAGVCGWSQGMEQNSCGHGQLKVKGFWLSNGTIPISLFYALYF